MRPRAGPDLGGLALRASSTPKETAMAAKEQITNEQKELIKRKSWEKITGSPLMARFVDPDQSALRALFVGYWPFVDGFPAVIQKTYEATEQFARHGKVLSGALREMETDERNHRALWLRSVAAADIPEEDLYEAQPLPAVLRVTEAMLERQALWQRLLDFVAVEIVAEGISQAFMSSEKFRDRMGTKGTAWFKVHMVHPADQTTHEDIAYRAAVALMPGALTEPVLDVVDRTIQETVDRFLVAIEACVEEQDALEMS